LPNTRHKLCTFAKLQQYADNVRLSASTSELCGVWPTRLKTTTVVTVADCETAECRRTSVEQRSGVGVFLENRTRENNAKNWRPASNDLRDNWLSIKKQIYSKINNKNKVLQI
jgi:hypothetical protein